DLTKETVAAYFGRDMELHEESLARIRDFFTRTGRVMTPNNQKQAMMPRGCVVFPNDYGTAPALAVGDGTRTAVMLPGPPAELIPLWNEQVVPFLRLYTEGVLISRNIHIMGLGESTVEQMLHDRMVASQNPTIAPYCKSGEVRLRVTARAEDEATASAMCDGVVAEIREDPRIKPYVYGVDCDNAETALVRLFTERGLTVASAESCTGGMIGQRITAIPGASAVYVGGCITYTNQQKINLLGVDPATIAAHTEVSAKTAAEMAAGVRARLGADVGLSTTGYAGPGGGTEENPVGTVFIGIATRDGVTVHRLYYRQKSRDYVREAAASRVMLEAVKVIL
ncbi:MAG: CinA family nicotinamide mononucleotide deamidase-related protein, partial [Clostridia bacterium]|nr:CinA family nicotinamide mononucleotide deamidase-related protein [Clostridia bacterium]